jgi:O-antigen/teichoic acid export membrane protein
MEVQPGPPSEVTGARLIRNTLVNAVANASGAVITVALTPFLLHHLGTAQYGVWLLALTLTFSGGYLAFADLGLSEAAVRFIAEARARRDVKTINAIASTTTAVFAALGLVAGLLVVALAPLLVRVFDVGADLESAAKIVFALVAVQIFADLPATGWLAVIEGAQRYSWLRAIDVTGRIAWAIGVVIAVRAGHGIVALAVIALVVSVLEAFAAFVVAHRVQPGLHIRLGNADRATLRQTSRYGSAIAALRVLSVIYAQMDRVIVGVILGVAAVASYEVAFRVQSIAALALVIAGSALIPAAAYNSARSDTDNQREIYLRGTKYAAAFIVSVSVAALLYARPLIVTWVGPQFESMTGETRLFLVYPLFGCLNQVAVPMLIGMGRVRRVLQLQVVSVGLNLVASVLLASRYGIAGVIAGSLIGHAAVLIPYNRTFLATFEVTARRWARAVVLPNLPGPALQVAVGLVSLGWVEQLDQFWAVVAVCAASCAVNLSVFVMLGLGSDERRGLLRSVVGRVAAEEPAV